MAAVSIPPSPHAIGGIMASRRLALGENANLGNSPAHRPVVTPVKRSRSHSNAGENTPPNKRLNVDEKLVPRTPVRKAAPARIERKVPAEKQIVGRAVKQDRGEAEAQSLETILQWQRHYRKVFPSYVFFFENISEEARRRCVRGIESLGAREVQFFSKDVTHVITTRSVPSEENASQAVDRSVEARRTAQQENNQPRTINPSLLERSAEALSEVPRGKFNFDLAGIRKGTAPHIDLNVKRPVANKVDILQKAKELGIKVWQLEKLWRVLKTIFDNSQSTEGHNTRGSMAAQAKVVKQVDLSQMIKNEQAHERGDREINAGASEMIRLTGPYIYVRCMNEKTKPIMVREYPKVDRKEDGEWPQFRSAPLGKCPFIEEDAHEKRAERHREEKARKLAEAKAKAQAPAPARVTRTTMQPPMMRAQRDPQIPATSAETRPARQTYQLPPPPAKEDSTFTNGNGGHNHHPTTRLIGGEPVASGVQPSNITSAIRSQMISSTAAGPGARAGTSKEIHDLQRKALERNTGLRHSPRMYDMSKHCYRPPTAPTRLSREATAIPEDDEEDEEDDDEEEEEEEEPETRSRSKTSEKSKHRSRAREEKPGYCENCREKFSDFEDHIQSRKHRKFALDPINWVELDALLARLQRPLKKTDKDYREPEEEEEEGYY